MVTQKGQAMRVGLRKQQTRRRGAAAVEFAFIIPLVIFMIFGMIEFGRGFMVQHIITETARRACRFSVGLNGGQIPTSGKSYSGNWNQYVKDVIVDPTLTANGVTGYTTHFYVTDWGSTDIISSDSDTDISTAKSPRYSGNVYNPGSEITVVITVPYNAVSWGINQTTFQAAGTPVSTGFLVGGTLTGQYTLRRE
jgi:Flp pilus assembly protein TadG